MIEFEKKFYAVKMTMPGNIPVAFPLYETSSVRLTQNLQRMAEEFVSVFQKNILEKGTYDKILRYFPNHPACEIGEIHLQFKAGKNVIHYKELKLSFQFLYSKQEKGTWCFFPALNLEVFSTEEETFGETLTEAVKQEFIRKKRLSDMHYIVQAIWFGEVEQTALDVKLKVYTLSELAQAGKRESEKLFSRVAKPFSLANAALCGYEQELKQVEEAFKSRFNKCVLIVGKSSSGKTTLFHEAAQKLYKWGIDKKIWQTNASTLIKELTSGTGWQEQLTRVCKEFSETGDFLYVSNFAELFEVGQYVGNDISIGHYLRDYIARGELNLLSECTEEEYARLDLKVPHYLNLFQIVRLEEPPYSDLEKIILEKASIIAASKGLSILPEAAQETLRLQKRYAPYSGFPGKAIRFLERVILQFNHSDSTSKIVDKEQIINLFCHEAGMPRFMIDPALPMDVDEVRRFFAERVFGQPHAVDYVTNVLTKIKTSLTKPGKPIASMLYVGPTGVGKTEMAKVLAKFMFGSSDRIVRFDMSEYATAYDVLRLTGIGYQDDGVLTSAVRRESFCVLLFDEIEKAHDSFYQLLLQMLDEGRLTDSQGRLVNFCSTIIIMTSNIGAAKLQTNQIGFSSEMNKENIRRHFEEEVRKKFRPEIFNRFDQIVPFGYLDGDVIQKVTSQELSKLLEREGISNRKLGVTIAPEVYDYLGKRGYDVRYGAREMQRALREELAIPLARSLNQFSSSEHLQVKIGIVQEKLDVQVQEVPDMLDKLLYEFQQVTNADLASQNRRNMLRLQHGTVFATFKDEYDDIIKKMSKKDYKPNDKNVITYSLYIKLWEKFNVLSLASRTLERETALSVMRFTPWKDEWEHSIEQWGKDWFEFLGEFYILKDPQSGKVILNLFGERSDLLLDFYTKMGKELEATINVAALWYRESLYNERKNSTDENKKYNHFYLETYPTEPDWLNPKPEHDGDVLVGYSLSLTAPCIALYFRDENGGQEWHLLEEGKNKIFKNYVSVAQGDEFSLVEIHRKNLMLKYGTSRRMMGQVVIQDNLLNIGRREVYPNNRVAYFLEVLDAKFKATLDLEFI